MPRPRYGSSIGLQLSYLSRQRFFCLCSPGTSGSARSLGSRQQPPLDRRERSFMANKRLLVCDLDNTLYDWVSYFVASFNAMVDAAVEVMGCDRDELLDDLRAVHQRHHDSEHPFALLEAETVRKHY